MKLLRVMMLGCAQLVPLVLAAQTVAPREPLKRAQPPAAASMLCAPAADRVSPTDEQRREARDLATRALQAALLGDSATAREELRQAAALDPTDADLAYRLGRAHETVHASAEAVIEYCRFLALTPSAPEAPEVRARVSALASSAADPRAAPVVSAFQAGIEAYESGRMADAEAAFSTTIRRQPQWAEPYYNRAVTSLARGNHEAAVRDLEQFLRLKPETEDRAAIVARIGSLRRVTFSPGTALATSLVLPGAGQYYTRRPMRGVITSLGVGTAIAVALLQKTTTSTIEQTGTDPFGNEYTYTTTQRSRERPYAVPASGAAVAISLGSAIDAFRYAQRTLR
jgi:tetratricopeptide (TPR) repeat protein